MVRQPEERRSKPNNRDRVLALAQEQGLIGPRDLQGLKIHRMVLTRLTEEGSLERVGRGLYRPSDAVPMGDPDLVLVAARAPHAVIGLVTALERHGLTTEIPRSVDILLPRSVRPPTMEYPPLRVFTSSEATVRNGVTKAKIDGVQVRMTNPAKTVADCFKFRRRVGLEVALEALREGLRTRAFSLAVFAKYAKANRVLTFVRPYLEAMA